MRESPAEERPLRALLVANDGLSCGHVARMIAIAGALARVAAARGVTLRTVLATTSQAHALVEVAEAVVVQLPAPVIARRAGFTDAERRRLVSGAIDGVVRAFAPDLVVIDTFPLGPHRELAGVSLGYAKRALVRRHIPEAALAAPVLADGLELMDLVLVADDPGPDAIVLERAPMSKSQARKALGLPSEGRVFLVAAGGGGDEEATRQATTIARALVGLDAECTVALALGPLAAPPVEPVEEEPRLRRVQKAPLAPFLGAFDGAIAPAGYNTAHELAIAGVPAALFAQKRPFDDQAARAVRFGATVLEAFDDEALRAALQTMRPLRPVPAGGADRAAAALLDVVMRR